MNSEQNRLTRKKLVVYIPCHTDFLEAIEQARIISSEFDAITQTSKDYEVDLHIHLSVNGVILQPETLNDIKSLTRSYTYTILDIGGDANIAKGFDLGEEIENSFLWILSANDKIKDGGLELILEGIVRSQNCHIILIGNQKNFEKSTLSNPFSEALQGKPLGLISAVIFNSELCKKSYFIAKDYSWTGWGQLSVLDQIHTNSAEMKFLSINQSQIYTLDARSDFNQAEEFQRIGGSYARSFFGFPVLVAALYPPTTRRGRRILRQWLTRNFYLISYFESFVTNEDAGIVRNRFRAILKESGKLNISIFNLVNNRIILRIYTIYKRRK